MKISDEVKEIVKKHQNELKNEVFLPSFIEALVVGGIGCFDELRRIFESSGTDLKTIDFSKIK